MKHITPVSTTRPAKAQIGLAGLLLLLDYFKNRNKT